MGVPSYSSCLFFLCWVMLTRDIGKFSIAVLSVRPSVCHIPVLYRNGISSAYGSPKILLLPVLNIFAKFRWATRYYGSVEYRWVLKISRFSVGVPPTKSATDVSSPGKNSPMKLMVSHMFPYCRVKNSPPVKFIVVAGAYTWLPQNVPATIILLLGIYCCYCVRAADARSVSDSY